MPTLNVKGSNRCEKYPTANPACGDPRRSRGGHVRADRLSGLRLRLRRPEWWWRQRVRRRPWHNEHGAHSHPAAGARPEWWWLQRVRRRPWHNEHGAHSHLAAGARPEWWWLQRVRRRPWHNEHGAHSHPAAGARPEWAIGARAGDGADGDTGSDESGDLAGPAAGARPEWAIGARAGDGADGDTGSDESGDLAGSRRRTGRQVRVGQYRRVKQ